MFKKARDEPVSPAENCVYVENIQIQRSIYKIPKDVIELEIGIFISISERKRN
ncbi:MAG: hypothetical protein ACXW0J_02390 [Nitrososphaeraceae archaeon]